MTTPGNHESDPSQGFLARLGAAYRIHAVKAYRVSPAALPPVPRLPCLDHESHLHRQHPAHVAAYLEDRTSGDLHEVIYTPSTRHVAVDSVSTLGEHGAESEERLLAWLGEALPGCRIARLRASLLRGDLRVMESVRAQITLRAVLTGEDFEAIDGGIDRLRAISGVMERVSRVASWSIRTITPLLLAGVGAIAWLVVSALSPLLGETLGLGLRYGLLTVMGTAFLYFGLKAVHLTQMAARIWKRTSEYQLIAAERRRLARAAPRPSSSNEEPAGDGCAERERPTAAA